MVARGFTGQFPDFAVRGYPPPSLESFPLVLLIGVVAGLLGVAFNRGLLGLHRLFLGIRAVPAWALPGLVLAAVGLVAWWLPDATGGGHDVAQRLLSDQYPAGVGVLLVLLAAKFAATVASYGPAPRAGSSRRFSSSARSRASSSAMSAPGSCPWLLPRPPPSPSSAWPRCSPPPSGAAHGDHADRRDDRRAAAALRPVCGLPRRVPGRRGPARSPDLRGPARRRHRASTGRRA